MKDQAPHGNPVKGTTVEQEEHPTTREFVRSLLEIWKIQPAANVAELRPMRGRARRNQRVVDGVKRGSPADFFKMATESTNTLVIPTK